MVLVSPMVCEKVWIDRTKYDTAERRYYERLTQSLASGGSAPEEATEIEKTVDEAVPTKQTEPIKKNKNEGKADKANKKANSCPRAKTQNVTEGAKLPKGSQTKPNNQPCPSLTKSTNVNNLPEINKLQTCENIKNICNLKKTNEAKKIPPLDKQESTDLIILSETFNEQPTNTEELTQKKKKRSKKERMRKEEKKGVTQNANSWNSLAGEVAKARQHIKNSLQCIDDIAVTSNSVNAEVTNRLVSLERENQELLARMEKMEKRLTELEKALERAVKPGSSVQTPSKPGQMASKKGPAPQPPKKEEPEDDGIDLFGSDSEEEDEEATRIKEQRLAEYAAKKSKKPALVAKSSIILDVKPWDDETDMKLLEQEVRKIACDGLLWGASKLVPLAYGIHKLQISCVVEDEKVSIDWLQETIQEIEDYVQSVDIAAFNKI